MKPYSSPFVSCSLPLKIHLCVCLCVGAELSSENKAVVWPEEEWEEDVQHTLFLHYVSGFLGLEH